VHGSGERFPLRPALLPQCFAASHDETPPAARSRFHPRRHRTRRRAQNGYDFREAAAKAKSVLALPEWEQTPEAIHATVDKAIAQANSALDEIGALDPAKVTFQNTVLALDTTGYRAQQAASRIYFIKESSTTAELRAAASEAVKKFQDWAVGTDDREDVYRSVKAFEKTKPKLSGADQKLFQETLRDDRRAGLEFPPEKRQEVEQLGIGQEKKAKTSAGLAKEGQ